LGSWGVGECWSAGVLECWSAGVGGSAGVWECGECGSHLGFRDSRLWLVSKVWLDRVVAMVVFFELKSPDFVGLTFDLGLLTLGGARDCVVRVASV
jgi:hypothetical protein